MKGLEMHIILGIIVIIAAVLIVLLFSRPSSESFGNYTGSLNTWEDFCYTWTVAKCRESLDTHMIREGKDYGTPRNFCYQRVLGYVPEPGTSPVNDVNLLDRCRQECLGCKT